MSDTSILRVPHSLFHPTIPHNGHLSAAQQAAIMRDTEDQSLIREASDASGELPDPVATVEYYKKLATARQQQRLAAKQNVRLVIS